MMGLQVVHTYRSSPVHMYFWEINIHEFVGYRENDRRSDTNVNLRATLGCDQVRIIRNERLSANITKQILEL